jgi:hypothetical protein
MEIKGDGTDVTSKFKKLKNPVGYSGISPRRIHNKSGVQQWQLVLMFLEFYLFGNGVKVSGRTSKTFPKCRDFTPKGLIE